MTEEERLNEILARIQEKNASAAPQENVKRQHDLRNIIKLKLKRTLPSIRKEVKSSRIMQQQKPRVSFVKRPRMYSKTEELRKDVSLFEGIKNDVSKNPGGENCLQRNFFGSGSNKEKDFFGNKNDVPLLSLSGSNAVLLGVDPILGTGTRDINLLSNDNMKDRKLI